VAATVEATREILTDHTAFANFLPMELTRATVNAESALLLSATHSANGFDGLLNTSGIGSITINTNESPLDAIQRGIVSLRTGAAFATPDLAICSPTTLGDLRTQKDLQNRYLLDVVRSAGGINATAEDENLWGVPVRQTTQIVDNLVVLLSTQAGGGLVYIREALNVSFNPYYDTSHNLYQWICEERIALAVPRPAAVVTVSLA
jgi:HK97 family phage major capsid protein